MVKIGAGAEGEVFTIIHRRSNKLMMMKVLKDSKETEKDKGKPFVKQDRFQNIVNQIKINTVGVNEIQGILFIEDDEENDICFIMEIGWMGDLNQELTTALVLEVPLYH